MKEKGSLEALTPEMLHEKVAFMDFLNEVRGLLFEQYCLIKLTTM